MGWHGPEAVELIGILVQHCHQKIELQISKNGTDAGPPDLNAHANVRASEVFTCILLKYYNRYYQYIVYIN